ncbi:putative N-acetylmannosamine-6-phosphate 2-epimerase [Devosia sp.]|uniref:N-acetylmannosamine-6-phosphate 2-epimerase n=1 Tax=Devosia sp. TaxID=1871048 RepID=UPI001AC18DD5|nr:putative N-acetylmannosamine-6-phosphate 2-epimerase [Devosia sp.]MBN9308066.1 putative N-acetylmannosamine-6-phosphate 2-epimerase [Devosia sp.]
MSPILDRLKRQLVVSSQAMNPRSPLRRPEILALLAEAAELGGAGGFRVDGTDVVRLLRGRTELPIIGIAKDRREGFDNYITTSIADAEALSDAGADIVAIQATTGTRPGESFAQIAAAAHRRGRLVMADIATFDEAQRAVTEGADIVATTMVGHTAQTEGAARPPLDLVRRLLAELDVPVIVEGGIWTPEHVAASFAAGAHAVVCGSAITAPDIITSRLVAAIPA